MPEKIPWNYEGLTRKNTGCKKSQIYQLMLHELELQGTAKVLVLLKKTIKYFEEALVCLNNEGDLCLEQKRHKADMLLIIFSYYAD